MTGRRGLAGVAALGIVMLAVVLMPALAASAMAGDQAVAPGKPIGTTGPAAQSAAVDAIFAGATNGPGAAVIVLRDGQILHKKAYGLANLEHAIPNTPQTKFRIASITKTFTAVAILQLHERGQLNIEDPVAKYLPDCANGDRFTVRHLLTHTSGIREGNSGPLAFTPGERLEYSNTGYNLLGRIIEKVSGQTYEQYLQQHVFAAAKMTGSGCDNWHTIIQGRAAGYAPNPDGSGYRNADYIDMAGLSPSGGLYSTIEDLAAFQQALWDRPLLLNERSLAVATTPVRLSDGREGAYGMGWMPARYRGLRELGHGGDINGFNAYLAYYPDQRVTVIVLCNIGISTSASLPLGWQAVHRIADIYLADELEPEAKPADALTVDPALYDEYAGRYHLVDVPVEVTNAMGTDLVITRDGNRLLAQDKMAKAEIFPESPTTFSAKGSPAKLRFVRDQHGKVSELVVNLLGVRQFRAKRVEP